MPMDMEAQSHHMRPSAPLSSGRDQTEDADPDGYPQLARLMGSHSAFALCRRFTTVRARLLLQKQDHIVLLEEALTQYDRAEQRPLFHGSMRCDRNEERLRILKELDISLKDYDDHLERISMIAGLPSAAPRNRQSLRNWIEGTGSISRQESHFLEQDDLCTIPNSSNDGLHSLEFLVEYILASIWRLCRLNPRSSITLDGHIFTFKGYPVHTMARVLLTWGVVFLLVGPVIMLIMIDNVRYQIACISVASAVFLSVLSGAMHARSTEVFVAGATYAALLVAFIAGPGGKAAD